VTDGLLDVQILPTIPSEQRTRAIQELITRGEAAIEDAVVHGRVPWLEIESKESIQINLDGEPMIEKHFRFEVLPGSLRAHLPKDTPLFAR
jgi:diacylglycerol kinase family enzyme